MKNFWYVFWDNFTSAFKTKRFIVFFLLYLGAFILITFGLIQLQKFAEEQFKLQIEKKASSTRRN